jgi:putative heme-binding domain-containing protein
LYKIIRSGIAGTEMPPSALGERQIWQVAAFVKTLGRTELSSPVAGDAKRGAELYEDKGHCSQCHSVNGWGGAVGPVLDEVGARRSPEYLRRKLEEPEGDLTVNYLQVRLVTGEGRSLVGTRVNEDSFSIQIRDLSNNFHSFWKEELTELHKEWGKSSMPSYKAILNAAEIDDIVAFLATLQGSL